MATGQSNPDPIADYGNMLLRTVLDETERVLPDIKVEVPYSLVISREYDTTHKFVGRTVIISNEFKEKMHRKRFGTHADASKMEEVIKVLGFRPLPKLNHCSNEESEYVYKDLNKQQLQDLMTHAANQDYGEYDCFLCVILSYGLDTAVLCPGDEYLTFKDMLEPFARDKCPSLVLKPKIFLIQACWPYDRIVLDSRKAGPKQTPPSVKLPSYSDTILQICTVPGSWGWLSIGISWYVQVLEQALRDYWIDKRDQHGSSEELSTLMLRINNIMNQMFDENQHIISENYGYPVIRSTLTKKAYFRPKLDVSDDGQGN